MPLFAASSRTDLREAWREAWRKHRQGLPLEPLEAQLADVVAIHPEYHATLEADRAVLERDWSPEQGESNPFLHMGLHLVVRDGIATDRPLGIRAVFERLLTLCGSGHEAEHLLLDCLAETLWEAQRAGAPADEAAYLERARRRISAA